MIDKYLGRIFKLRFSEKATKFDEIFILDVLGSMEISSNFGGLVNKLMNGMVPWVSAIWKKRDIH